jgi:hypothetical protein
MGAFVVFMRSTAGRIIRAGLGLYLIYLGFVGTAGVIVGLLGVVALAAGVINFCVLAPLFGYSMMGKKRGVATK